MKSYFFVGIGGSGMLPLAEIVAAQGHAAGARTGYATSSHRSGTTSKRGFAAA